eukprot:CAMPEP_0117423058 /NCGR_PEP_ID=MMETSP0758-20121206/3774_1 /TAXON_ID=63605 /ORGANISM="Percolomonas cosmopolitus, Strain AE-1 (ATCC 50343)" /LENGTH=314 /DNA_ID=CAMNT_0005206051 /DNA_START=131 /DNA_END=1078 /DNA_ORIENTATION=-
MFAIGYKLFTTQLIGHNGYMYYLKKQRDHSHTTIIEPFLKLEDGLGEVHAIPFLGDNYTYVVIYENTKCLLIDPAEPYKVLKFLKEQKLTPTHLLTTHHHWDHAGGNFLMRETFPKLMIYGSALEKNVKFDVSVHDKDVIRISDDLSIECIMTEGHTLGHVCYLMHLGDTNLLFSGDALFCAGAGKLFEGTIQQYAASFLRLRERVPPNAFVCCGHEYSVSNLEFAASIEPDNKLLHQKLLWASSQREKSLPTLPTTFAEELAYNPFLRASLPHLQEVTCTKNNHVMTIQMLRMIKDKGKNAEEWTLLLESLKK